MGFGLSKQPNVIPMGLSETEKLHLSYLLFPLKLIRLVLVQFYGKSVGFGLSKQPNVIPMSLSKQKNCTCENNANSM